MGRAGESGAQVSEPLVDVALGVISAIFGAGVAFGSMRSAIRAAEVRAGTAIEQAQDALGRIAFEQNRVTRADGRADLLAEKIRNLEARSDEMVTREVLAATTAAQTSELRRTISRAMPAARDPRQDSDPPSQTPAMRPRLPSRRDT